MPQDVVIFPGQGCQKMGMAADFHREHAAAREVFDCASEALQFDMEALCFAEDPRLHLTAFTQPAILTAEIAMYRSLRMDYGLTEPMLFAGHSLGEYSALVAAGVIPLDDALRLVHLRGQSMQSAVSPDSGAMAALIRDDLRPEAITPRLEGLCVDIANINSPNQIVISGNAEDIDVALQRLLSTTAAEGARARKLNVSAPFHCRLMASIEPAFREALEASADRWASKESCRVLSNTSGALHDGSREGLVERLCRQISGEVRWTQNMKVIVNHEPRRIIEVGPGRPLRGFFRGIGESVISITNLVSARRALLS
jgi:malonyl CoA-acyl carrier protein transacylase